jgi:hypothetical protein
MVSRANVDDNPPNEAETAAAVRRLCTGKAPGPSRIQT